MSHPKLSALSPEMLIPTTQSPHLPYALAKQVDILSISSGIAADQIRLLACLLLAIPLGLLHTQLPSARSKHLMSITVGLLFVYGVVGADSIHLLIMSTIVYTFLQLHDTKPNTATRPGQTPTGMSLPLTVFLFCMSYLSAIHIYRLYTDWLGYKLECSMLLMVAVPKCCMMACNLEDGKTMKTNTPLHSNDKISAWRSTQALHTRPTLIEYFSYILFFPAVLVGPVVPVHSYYDFIQQSVVFTPTGRLHGIGVALLNFSVAGVMFLLNGNALRANGYVDSAEFLYNTTWLYRVVYINVVGWFCRSKYYVVWYLSQVACIAAGYGKIHKPASLQPASNSKNGKGISRDYSAEKQRDQQSQSYSWDGACNAHMYTVETAPSFQQVSNNWNIGVSDWLKFYVYQRAVFPKSFTKVISQRTLANITTKATSAFYHGFYPSYYLFFMSMAIVTTASEYFYLAFERYFVRSESDSVTHETVDHTQKLQSHPTAQYLTWRILCWIVIYSPLNVLGMSFILLDTQPSLLVWKRCYYYGHVMPILVLIVSIVVLKLHPKKKRDAPPIKNLGIRKVEELAKELTKDK